MIRTGLNCEQKMVLNMEDTIFPIRTPAKADPLKQASFIQYYENLLKTLPEDEPVEFGDSVHPTMAKKISYKWIPKGTDKLIETTVSRTRMNLLSSLSLETMKVLGLMKCLIALRWKNMSKNCARIIPKLLKFI